MFHAKIPIRVCDFFCDKVQIKPRGKEKAKTQA